MSTVEMVVRCVVEAGTSLRAAAGVHEIARRVLCGEDQPGPSHVTVRNLLLRLGLYEVTRPKEFAADWLWIVDHTIQAGTTKCFLVVGIRHRDFLRLDRPLEHHDLQMLALIPVETSTGAIVHQQFLELAGQCGVPLAILSDHGSDLKKGVELLQQDHPEVIALYDIVHKTSRLMDQILSADEQWASYRQACCRCANSVRQTRLSHLKPPKPKTKARHMNIEHEIRWGARALSLLNSARAGTLDDDQLQDLPLPFLEETFGWLDEYADALNRWEQLSVISQTACRTVRISGYDQSLPSRMESALATAHDQTTGDQTTHDGSSGCEAANRLATGILDFCEHTATAVGSTSRLPGSSEVIESLIGKRKRMASHAGAGGMTGQILTLAASVVEPTREFLAAALKACGIKTLQHWCQTFLPTSSQSLRARDLVATRPEQNLRKSQLATTPNF
jgi:hypothetical protein